MPVNVFISYAHRDERLLDSLRRHLKPLERNGLIGSWHDRKIVAGSEWTQAIDHALESADIILLLVSEYFLASDYCFEKEMKRAMARHEAGDARVIGIQRRWGADGQRRGGRNGAAVGHFQSEPSDAGLCRLEPPSVTPSTRFHQR